MTRRILVDLAHAVSLAAREAGRVTMKTRGVFDATFDSTDKALHSEAVERYVSHALREFPRLHCVRYVVAVGQQSQQAVRENGRSTDLRVSNGFRDLLTERPLLARAAVMVIEEQMKKLILQIIGNAHVHDEKTRVRRRASV
ncbi:hypothetical protein CYMTET_6268 [Cymbomonas tetramitiformis]|uniref:Uncharacterized protein n=1 Tax=Cymbomonas tetramitiformis TaxID=36881 RepID=A0AAE0GXV4_9CHLO|nr:hypothetical protein CYMTET_6268 [Cymbomonas tetramitiformis]